MIIQFKLALGVRIENELTDRISKTMKGFTGSDMKVCLSGEIGTTKVNIEGENQEAINNIINDYIKYFHSKHPDKTIRIMGSKIYV